LELSVDEHIKIYKELRKYKEIVGSIDKDYFFKVVDLLLNRLQDLEKIDKAHKDIIGELTIRNDERNKAIGKEYQLGYAQGEYEVNEYWKSKIREKIKPTIEGLEKDGFVGYADELRDILQDLLEENK